MASPGHLMTRFFSAAHRGLFRATRGRMGGSMRGAPILLLTTTGRRSGKLRTSPLIYVRDGDDYVIAASNAGRDFNPRWYDNLLANPDARVHLGRERTAVHAETVPDGPDRQRLGDALVALFADYAVYQIRTRRPIPLVRLRPRR